MLKSLTAIFSVLALLAGAVIFEHFFVQTNFVHFHEELTTLYEKVEADEANVEDARAVRTAWEARKEQLQVFLPHNDVARVDLHLYEAVRLIGEGERSLALAKLETLLNLAATFPQAYRATPSNIF